ncbi:MAG: aminotransferase class III-fold pyridoxal phosphate-dependent enzyme, partial [Methanomicrobiales archaeon]
ACAAALATIGVIEGILPTVIPKGERFRHGLSVHNPRVRGLMVGITVGQSCPEVQKRCAARGVLINCAADGNIRLVPPLVIGDAEIDTAIEVIHEALG